MPATGLYFIPTAPAEISPLPDIVTRLTTTYNLNPVPRWSLEHRLFRETPNPDRAANNASLAAEEKAKPAATRYLQILALSYLPGRSYVAITTTHAASQARVGVPASSNVSADNNNNSGDPATIVSIPSGAQSEDFIQLLVSKFGPLWTQRPSLGVGYGQAFEVGDYGVRVGELRQGVGSGQLVRGAVVQVQSKGGDEVDRQEAEGFIRAFWETLGIKGAREILKVPGMDGGDRDVRQWCEVLRLRG